MLPDSIAEAFAAWWPHVYAWIILIVGVTVLVCVRRALALGYIYDGFKYEWAERNRIYRDRDPFWFWFFAILYGVGSIFIVGYGVVAIHRVYFVGFAPGGA